MIRKETVALRQDQVRRVVGRVERGESVAVVAQPGQGRARLLADVEAFARDQGRPVLRLRVPHGLDQVERVVLELAAGARPEVRHQVDEALRRDYDDPRPALEALDAHVRGMWLLVDDLDLLGRFPRNRELSTVLGPRCQRLGLWLGERVRVAAVRRPPGDRFTREPLDVLASPPGRLRNGEDFELARLWEDAGHQLHLFELALARAELTGRPPGEEPMEESCLREAVTAALPGGLHAVLRTVSLHGRALDPHLLRSVVADDPLAVGHRRVGEDDLVFGARLGLWRYAGRRVEPVRGWRDWFVRTVPPDDRRAIHRRLALAFAGQVDRNDEDAGLAGLAIHEAHRHFMAAGDVDRASDFARYGAMLLIEHARASSLRRRFDRAAALYRQVLELGGEAGRVPLGSRVRAYAWHYLHFNRARAGQETLAETERGYERAVELWKENALFWSRLVRVRFYRDDRARALETWRRAERVVPEHHEKDLVLRVRTVRGLLRQEPPRVEEALILWGGYQPSWPVEREVAEVLFSRLAEGWTTRRLHPDGVDPVFLHQDVRVRVEPAARGRHACVIEGLDVRHMGKDPAAAYRGAVEALRREVAALVRSFTHRLDRDARLRKRVLLGLVDVPASRLDAEGADEVWVVGEVVRADDGRLVLRAGGPHDGEFAIPAELARGLVPAPRSRFARVKADRGMPVGPVVRLDAFLDGGDVWEQWRRRVADGR